ncbi:hypothetical protein L6R50_25945 [Myxococcota bacterium]|nr:hypothetical protein [Myxococcota bacterium]
MERAILARAKGPVVINRQPAGGGTGSSPLQVSSYVVQLGDVDVRDLVSVATPRAVLPAYEWDFGDGETEVTSTPQVVHDFFSAVDHAAGVGRFHVRCRIVHDGIEITRTLTLHSAYAACRARGVIVPHVVADTFTTKCLWFFTWSLVAYNVEDQPLVIDRYALAPLAKEGSEFASPSHLVHLTNTVTIPARGSAVLAGSVTIGDIISSDAPGFTVHYAGKAGDDTPVRFTAVFEQTLADRAKESAGGLPDIAEAGRVWPWEEVERRVLDAAARMESQGWNAVSVRPEAVATDAASRTVALAYLGIPAAREAAAQRRAGSLLASAARAPMLESSIVRSSSKTEPRFGVEPRLAIPPSIGNVSRGSVPGFLDRARVAFDGKGFQAIKSNPWPALPGLVLEGQICDPDNLTEEDLEQAAEQQLVCQATTEQYECLMPARFMNARKGDVILSPGGTGLIGSLLRHVDPPQNYSHSGIMTRNYDEVTHSTASEDRLLDYKVGLVDGGDGIEPRVLKYMWPGVVTQSVEAAVAEVAEMFVDPQNGKSYAISSFSPHAIGVSHNGTMEVVYPLVDEEWGDDEYTDPGAEYHERELGPDRVTNTLSRTYKWGGELRAEYSVSFALLVDNSVQVTVEGLPYEGTTEGTDDLDGAGSVTFNVPLDQTASAKLVITNTDENDDDRAEFTITVKNARNSN